MTSFIAQYENYAEEFNAVLGKFLKELDCCRPQILADSLKYSLEVGGKRFRPVLLYAAGDAIGVEHSKLDDFALAIELIHTYSLIHDDLPEMDNDDFRRGKPSNHKVFGVGNAVLAGDGLLNTAYSILLGQCRKGSEYISVAEHICDCAGIKGMIAGQSADLLHENDLECDEETLGFIYNNKTAKMIVAPLIAPSILSGGKYYSEMKILGENLGNLFQLTDDILDVEGEFSSLGKSTGKDKSSGKYTAVKLFGLDGAKFRADILADKCARILDGINGNTSFLKELVTFVRTRKK